MALVWLALIAAAAPSGEAVVRESFLRGDLVSVARAKAIIADRGEVTELGSIALVSDLVLLVSCRTLAPVPPDDPLAAARRVIRLERLRLSRILKENIYLNSPLVELLGAPPLFQTKAPDQSNRLVRWPVQQERWPDEIIEGVAQPLDCPSKPGALKETKPEIHALNSALRAAAERSSIAALLSDLEALPDETAGRIALTYARDASEAAGFVYPLEWSPRIEAGLERGETRVRSAGLLLVARLREGAGDPAGAKLLYRALADDPRTSNDEDSRLRLRLAALEEPDFERALAVARGTRKVRRVDEPARAYAEARALYALHRFDELMTFGRVWLRTERGDGPFDAAVRDLLLRLAVELPPSQAMAWVDEIGSANTVASRLDQLGALALEIDNLPLATAIYDRLRVEAAGMKKKRGPSAAAEEARWIAQRARVEFAAEDAEAFAVFVDALVTMANTESERPLARLAPLRELARLSQDLIGRMTNEVSAKPERRKFAALLLEGAMKMSVRKSRYQKILEEHAAPLRLLAGPYAVGRDGRARADARKGGGKQEREKELAARKVRQLGEVVVPRLPPRIEAEDVPTELPEIRSYLVYETPDGRLVSGVPWERLARIRREAKLRAKLPSQPQ
jgi:hypothetical protein